MDREVKFIIPKKCENKGCNNLAIWKVVSECMVGASEWNFFCKDHLGKNVVNGSEVYLSKEGWQGE